MSLWQSSIPPPSDPKAGTDGEGHPGQHRRSDRNTPAIHKTAPELTEKSLDDWYLGEKKDSATADRYEAFSEKYPLNGEIKEQEGEIDRMKGWCDKAEISFTPTIYINGHRLPEKYSVQELKYIL